MNIDIDKVFDSLVDNAFDFLTRAVDEFQDAPKYSVIHFVSSVELLLKAKLIKQKLSLVLSEPYDIAPDKFLAGDFKSASLKDCCKRIEINQGKGIDKDTYDCFCALANHRNRIIHFYHGGLDGGESERVEIVAEQARAWFYLHRLLEKWGGDFREHSARIKQADKAMHRHKSYLAEKFSLVSSEISHAGNRGALVVECPACNFCAALTFDEGEGVFQATCLVCQHSCVGVSFCCDSCENMLSFVNEGWGECSSCSRKYEPSDLADVLFDSVGAYCAVSTGAEAYNDICCGVCSSHYVVRRPDDTFFCCACFDQCNGGWQCDWCGVWSTSNPSDDYVPSCDSCEGPLGRVRDD